MSEPLVSYDAVAVSTRIRLARNFADYPFPNRLSREDAREIVELVSSRLKRVEAFDLHYMNAVSDEKAAFWKECYLISRALIRQRAISAVLLPHRSRIPVSVEEEIAELLDENISVMINEEDHIRAQYFVRGFDLRKGYERLSGLDDFLSEAIPFAFDRKLGFLTACPTNLGTGLRASVMLFLPALSERGKMGEVEARLKYLGLTVRGVFGEGSRAEGDLFQVSNEVTLGVSEEEILSVVEENVEKLIEDEILERKQMKQEGGIALADRLLRSYGILCNCACVDEHEFSERMSDVKLGVALGYLEGTLPKLDPLIVSLRPANMARLSGVALEGKEEDLFRASYAGRRLREMNLLPDYKRNEITSKESFS